MIYKIDLLNSFILFLLCIEVKCGLFLESSCCLLSVLHIQSHLQFTIPGFHLIININYELSFILDFMLDQLPEDTFNHRQ